MRALAVSVLGAGLMWACGCTRKRPALPSMKVPVSCASEITLVGCDARMSPPKCKSARVTYRKGCEEIVAGK